MYKFYTKLPHSLLQVTEPQRPKRAPTAMSHLSEHMDALALNPEPPPPPLRFTHFL